MVQAPNLRKAWQQFKKNNPTFKPAKSGNFGPKLDAFSKVFDEWVDSQIRAIGAFDDVRKAWTEVVAAGNAYAKQVDSDDKAAADFAEFVDWLKSFAKNTQGFRETYSNVRFDFKYLAKSLDSMEDLDL